MNKRIFIVMLVCLCMAITACSQKTENTEHVSMYDLQKTMLQADETLPEMTTVNSNAEDAEDLFSYLSDLEYSKVESYFLAYSSEGLADEVAVIRCKNVSDVEKAVATLKSHVEARVSLYTSYQPDQVDRARSAMVFREGNYAVLIISENQKEIKTAFLDAIGE